MVLEFQLQLRLSQGLSQGCPLNKHYPFTVESCISSHNSMLTNFGYLKNCSLKTSVKDFVEKIKIFLEFSLCWIHVLFSIKFAWLWKWNLDFLLTVNSPSRRRPPNHRNYRDLLPNNPKDSGNIVQNIDNNIKSATLQLWGFQNFYYHPYYESYPVK